MQRPEGAFMPAIGKPKPSDMVVKGNALVHASYVMTWQEKMLMWFTIWAYQQQGSKKLTIKCQDFGEYAGIDHGRLYANVWMTARRLRERELLLWKDDENRVGALGFLSYVEYGKDRSGEVDVVITDEIIPQIEKFIAELKIGFTKYEMGVIASLKTFHALRLYEIAKSVYYGEFKKDGWEVTVEELRKRFGALVLDRKGNVLNNEYPEWKRFRSKVLDKAIREVNEATDLKVSYELRKSGCQVIAVRLKVEANKSGASVMRADIKHKDLAQAMAKLGVSGRQIDKLIATYGDKDATRLEFALRQTYEEMKGGKIKNAAAWFVAAVKRDDRKQGQLFSSEHKKLEAAERARERKLRERPSGPDKGMQAVANLLPIDGELGAALARLGRNVKAKPAVAE